MFAQFFRCFSSKLDSLILFMLGQQLGECIGRGQFGSVYRALNLTNGRVVAIKRIGLDGLSDSEILHLSNEIELLKDLSHPSIVSYEGVIRTENYVNIVLECVLAFFVLPLSLPDFSQSDSSRMDPFTKLSNTLESCPKA